MKERLIILYTHEARTILDGTRTMIRRVINPQPVGNADVQFRVASAVTIAPTGKQLLCPYGVPGDRLYVKWTREDLEVTEVRVERLQDISESDAIAEGAPPSHPTIDVVSRELGYPDFSRSWFAQLWESINGPGSWDANPWVWVVRFKVLK